MLHRQLHDGRQLHPHPGAVEAGAQRSARLGIKYDPSHSFVHGGAQGAYLDEALEWGSRIQYVHVKGVIQRGPSEEPTMWAIRDLAAATQS